MFRLPSHTSSIIIKLFLNTLDIKVDSKLNYRHRAIINTDFAIRPQEEVDEKDVPLKVDSFGRW